MEPEDLKDEVVSETEIIEDGIETNDLTDEVELNDEVKSEDEIV